MGKMVGRCRRVIFMKSFFRQKHRAFSATWKWGEAMHLDSLLKSGTRIFVNCSGTTIDRSFRQGNRLLERERGGGGLVLPPQSRLKTSSLLDYSPQANNAAGQKISKVPNRLEKRLYRDICAAWLTIAVRPGSFSRNWKMQYASCG